MIGIIVINTDMWESNIAVGLQRANKDAEVTVACLILHEHMTSPLTTESTKEHLTSIATNLVFDGRAFGRGTTFQCHVLKLNDHEDALRIATGMSAHRKCLHLEKLCATMISEKRRKPNCGDADAVLAVFKEEGVSLKGWNPDTMRRYLQIAKKLRAPAIITILQRSELLFKREGFLDGITSLRAVLAASATNEDLVYAVNKLVLEQTASIRAGSVRSKNDHNLTLTNIAKGVFLRRSLYAHLTSLFP